MNDRANPSHVIRLNAAWERIETADDHSIVRSSKVSLPDALPFSDATTHVCYQRKFNAPTGLTDSDALLVESDFLGYAETVTLNDRSLLTDAHDNTADIKSMLQSFNQLRVTLPVSLAEKTRSATARLLIYSV